MKTRNLTQSSPRNDPINHRMHGFSFRDFEDEDGVQDVISPCENVSRMQRNWMTLELWCLDSSINLENPRVSFRLKKSSIYRTKEA